MKMIYVLTIAFEGKIVRVHCGHEVTLSTIELVTYSASNGSFISLTKMNPDGLFRSSEEIQAACDFIELVQFNV